MYIYDKLSQKKVVLVTLDVALFVTVEHHCADGWKRTMQGAP